MNRVSYTDNSISKTLASEFRRSALRASGAFISITLFFSGGVAWWLDTRHFKEGLQHISSALVREAQLGDFRGVYRIAQQSNLFKEGSVWVCDMNSRVLAASPLSRANDMSGDCSKTGHSRFLFPPNQEMAFIEIWAQPRREVIGFFLGLISIFVPFFLVGIFFVRKLRTGVQSGLENILNLSMEQVEAAMFSDGKETGAIPTELRSIFQSARKIEGERRALEMQLAEARIEQAIAHEASQAAHDIRSPVTSLRMIEPELDSLPAGTRMIVRSAIERIRKIADDFSRRSKLPALCGENSIVTEDRIWISKAVFSILGEKRVEISGRPGIRIHYSATPGSFNLMTSGSEETLKRVLSNLINNSVEALERTGAVSIHVSELKENETSLAKISVVDDGKGIPSEILSKLGQRGFSWGKGEEIVGGSGLGLWGAKEFANNLGGRLAVSSIEGEGTTIDLVIPTVVHDMGVCECLYLKKGDHVVVLDDDESVHSIWSARLEQTSLHTTLHSFYDPIELSNFIKAKDSPGANIFLLDWNLGAHKVNGLELAKEIGVTDRTIIVTTESNLKEIQTMAKESGVKLLPKFLIPFVSLSDKAVEATPYT